MDTFSETHARRARSKIGGALVAVLVALTVFATVAPTADAAQLSPDQEELADLCRFQGGIPAISNAGEIICLTVGGIFRCSFDGPVGTCTEEVVLAAKPTRGEIGNAAELPTGASIVDDVIASRPKVTAGHLR